MKPRRRIIVTGVQRPDLDARALANLLIALDEHLNQRHHGNTAAPQETPHEPDTPTATNE